MEEAIIKFYRRLLRTDFENAGGMENPTAIVEAIGEKMVHCGNSGNYMQLYFKMDGLKLVALRYQCACEPAANVAVEVLCTLARGKMLDEALKISEADFFQVIGSEAEELRLKIQGLLEMLREGIRRCRAHMPTRQNPAENIQW